MIDPRRLRLLAALACLWGVGWSACGCGLNRDPIEEAPPGGIAAAEEPAEPPVVLVNLGLFCLPDSEIDGLTFIADPWPYEEVVILDGGGHERLAKELDLATTVVVVASPSVAVHAGEPAAITVGEGWRGRGAGRKTGFAFEIRPVVAQESDSTVQIDLSYTQYVAGELVSSWSGSSIALEPGQVALVRLRAEHAGLPAILSASASVVRQEGP